MSAGQFFVICFLLFYCCFLSIPVQSLLFIRFNQPIDKYLLHGPTQKSLKYSYTKTKKKQTNNRCFNFTFVFQIDVLISLFSKLINKFHIQLIDSIINTIIYFGRRREIFFYKIKHKLTNNYYFFYYFKRNKYKYKSKIVEKVIYNLTHLLHYFRGPCKHKN
jgi:hypothetical protein